MTPPVDDRVAAPTAPKIVPRGLGMTCNPFRGIEMEAAPVSDIAVIRVLFATGSDQLTPAAERTLAPLAEALRSEELRPYCFRIDGHTDSVGSDESNRRLSERRAQSVVRFSPRSSRSQKRSWLPSASARVIRLLPMRRQKGERVIAESRSRISAPV